MTVSSSVGVLQTANSFFKKVETGVLFRKYASLKAWCTSI